MLAQSLNQSRVMLIELDSMAAGMFDGIQLNFSGTTVRHGLANFHWERDWTRITP
jgi:hypothetical protein